MDLKQTGVKRDQGWDRDDDPCKFQDATCRGIQRGPKKSPAKALGHRSASPAEIAELLRLKMQLRQARKENDRLSQNAAEAAIELLKKLMSVTSEIFRGEATCFETFDPEFPSEPYNVMAVITPLEPNEIVVAEKEWIRAISEMASSWDTLRLSIRPN